MISVRVVDDAELASCLAHKSADDDDDDDDDAGEFTASSPAAADEVDWRWWLDECFTVDESFSFFTYNQT